MQLQASKFGQGSSSKNDRMVWHKACVLAEEQAAAIEKVVRYAAAAAAAAANLHLLLPRFAPPILCIK